MSFKKPSTHQERRARRQTRVRSRVTGTAERPRLSVFRSLLGMYVQLIDDVAGKTLIAVHSREVKAGDAGDRAGKVKIAYLMGKLLAERAAEKKITSAVFDRGGYAYHGRVAAVADGARDGGLTC